MQDDHFMTTEEVIQYLQVNLRTVYRLIKDRGLPAVRVGRQWRFRKSAVDRWVELQNRDGVNGAMPPLERHRVLIVDDEQAVRDLVAKTLAMAQYDVDTATDGASAVERLRGEDYDLLITDLRMPGMDGLAVIREARRKSAELPIIIITGHSTEASAIEAINLGVSGYLTKPFRLPRIVSAAARALGDSEPPQHPDL